MRLRILVVDDEPLMLKLIAMTLTSCGADVVALSDSDAALLRLRLEKFDGIFLDLLMPGVSGMELTREARKSPCNRTSPIVIVTGLLQPDLMSQVFAAGATFLLHKPVDRKKLVKLFNAIAGAMLREQRKFGRIPLSDSTLTCIDGLAVIEGRISDVSETGLIFQGDGSLRKDQTVELRFPLPGRPRPVETAAVILRIDEQQRVECQFTGLSETDRDAIRKVITDFLQSSAAFMGW
jgi:CheY-like chemotaxis protein